MTDFLHATIKALDSADGPGQFEAILSTATLDRDGEVIAPRAFEPLPKSIPIYMEHDWKSGALPAGRGEPYYEGDDLKLRGTFASTARGQEARALVVEGVVDSMSVGFLNGKREQKSGVRTVVSGEVFEGSLTAIPINTGARVLAAKALDAKAGARNSAEDAARLQQIHDLAAENGAMCTGSKAIGTKAIEGSVEALQERVRDALEDAYGDWSTCLRGVLPDKVIFDWYAGDGDTYEQTYTDDGAVVTLTGEPVEVDVHEIVVSDADADREDNEPGPGSPMAAAEMLSLPGSAGDAPASAGASPADEAEQEMALLDALRARV